MRFNQAVKNFLFIFCVLMTSGQGFAQSVKITNLKQLEQRFQEGRDTTYVVNFWATWCAPCVAELPYFEKLAQEYRHQPLKVILVSLDFKSQLEKAVIPFVQTHHLKCEVYLNEENNEDFINRVNKDWSGAIPATLMVNKQQSVRRFFEKEFTFEELEDAYLKNTSP